MVVRLLKWAVILVLALVVLAVGAVAFLFYRAMPDYAGVAHLPGLSGEVRVYCDDHGVPHAALGKSEFVTATCDSEYGYPA